MKIFKFFSLFIIIIVLISCSKEPIKKSVINEKGLNEQVLEAYEEGLNSLKEGDVIYAAKKFNEEELLYPQSEWASKAVLLSAYAYYSQNYYQRSIEELESLIKKYTNHKNMEYEHLL